MKIPKFEDMGTREKILLSAMAVSLIAMFLSVAAWWFLSGLEGMQREVKPLERAIRDAKQLIKSEKPITADYLRIESMLGASLSDAESISDMKQDIENLARGAGLTCDPPSHTDPVADPSLPWREYKVQVANCEGSMDALLSFIGAVESAPVVYRVEKMTVAPAKRGPGVSASIVISRIMLPPKEEPDVSGEES